MLKIFSIIMQKFMMRRQQMMVEMMQKAELEKIKMGSQIVDPWEIDFSETEASSEMGGAKSFNY
jgi:hypothetical protein